ncbi:MAG: FecR domain-containing protein [Prevotella sp.]|jgi:ferric-dicitrate binding protein FerR (iron transport regulator)|nr:FecR domain-containing protein [Prevotella sp.]
MDNRIIKYFEGNLDISERINLLNEMEMNESLKEDFISYRNISGLVSLSESPGDEDEGRISYQAFIGKQQKIQLRRKVQKIFSYAASIAILIAATYFITSKMQNPPEITATNKLYVPSGQRANITLSDGTEVWVNANSTIIYPSTFTQGERKIELTGEAFFTVAKNEKKPFIVSTSDFDVKVLGTTFNINSYNDMEEKIVSLIEGSVEVISPNEKMQLIPNEQLKFRNSKMSVAKFYNEDDFSWTQGIYTFEEAPLSDILKKMELYYDVKIIVKNPSVSQIEYTGKFRQRDGVMEILKILQKVYPFRIQKDEQNNIITIE